MQATIPCAAAPQVFQFHTAQIRTVIINGEPWFFAADVCAALSIVNTNTALAGLDDDEKCEHRQYEGSGRKPLLINESGLYSLILRSRKPQAKAFRRWVTNDVLPAIRKTGRYATPAAPEAPRRPSLVDVRLLRQTLRQIAEVVVPGNVGQFIAFAEERILSDNGIFSWAQADASVLLYARDFINELRDKAIQMKDAQVDLQARYWLWFFQPGRTRLPDSADMIHVGVTSECWFPKPL